MKISIDKSRACQRCRQRGVSLVELLIVLSIVAMVAGVVIINAPPARSDLRQDADSFAARLDFAAQDAITRGVLIGMTLSEGGYEFYTYNRGEWREREDQHVAGEAFSSDYTVKINKTQTAERNEITETKRESEAGVHPDVLFSPTGETTEFSVSFKDRRDTFSVTLDNAGHVAVIQNERAQ
ncbi:MAG: hypothetical protein DHS20C04_03800 [Hyphococcus sp.]|nr:MAG: hypothetical protein DHS20C04_03800 [Marinicaulis sp.]